MDGGLKQQQLSLLEKSKESRSKEGNHLIATAMDYLEKINIKIFHSDKKVSKNIGIATILADLKADPATIVASLLCSKLLSKQDFQEIKEEFGQDVALLIENKIRFENTIKSEKKIIKILYFLYYTKKFKFY